MLDDAHMERIHAIVPRAWYSMSDDPLLRLVRLAQAHRRWLDLGPQASVDPPQLERQSDQHAHVHGGGRRADVRARVRIQWRAQELYFTRLHIVYGYFWCFATFCELFASFISLLFLVGANEVENPMQRDHFEKRWAKMSCCSRSV